MSSGPCLSIDFGTSHTVGIVAWPDGRTRTLLFDGSPLLPSSVYAESAGTPDATANRADGEFLVGRDAVHAARVDPSRFEDAPKRRIDDGTVLLGTSEYPVSTMIAAVLARVRDEAIRVIGGRPEQVVMSHPANWGVTRRLILLEAAGRAGLGEPVFVPEPAAAARYFATVIGRRFPEGHGLLVYDFGGGTFDASLVVRDRTGYDVRAVDGVDDLGGLDLDEAIVGHAMGRLDDEHADALARLRTPRTTEDRRYRRMLWDDARMAKERLSRARSTTLHVPLAGVDITVHRDAFEALARPMIERTVRTAASVLRWSKLPGERLVGIFLVGGSSRIPLVASLIVREFGVEPTIMEQPELVVAEGALSLGQTASDGSVTVTLPQIAPVSPPAPAASAPMPAAPPRPGPGVPAGPGPDAAAGRGLDAPAVPGLGKPAGRGPDAPAPATRPTLVFPPVSAARPTPGFAPARVTPAASPPRPPAVAAPPHRVAAAPGVGPRPTAFRPAAAPGAPGRPGAAGRSGGRWLSVLVTLLMIGALGGMYLYLTGRVGPDHRQGANQPTATDAPSLPATRSATASGEPGTSTSSTPSPGVSSYAERVVVDATFVTPSRNIACRIDGDGAWCQISQTMWSPPPRPQSGCDAAGYGSNLSVGSSGEGELACGRDQSVLGSGTDASRAAVLEYGHALRTKNALCASTPANIRCENTATGHGFTLAKESYTLF